MKIKIYILTFLIILISISESFATAQTPDKLIYKGDTLYIYANPLEQLLDIVPLRKKLFGNKNDCYPTACWRGYQAEWTIIKNQLFLTSIYSCCSTSKSETKADLKQLFKDKFINGKVKASWVTDELLSPQGKQLYYVHNGYGSLYEKEVLFKIKKGKLTKIQTFDNSKSKQSIYSRNYEKLNNHIYSNICWGNLPAQENPIKISVSFSTNEQGIVDSVRIVKGFNDIFNQEAIRVIKTIPEWNVYYRFGKHEKLFNSLDIKFSEENRKKHSNKLN